MRLWKVPRLTEAGGNAQHSGGQGGKPGRDTHPAPEQEGAFTNKKDGWNGRRDITWGIANASGQW